MSDFTEAFYILTKHLHIPPGYRYPAQLITDWSKLVTNLRANGYHDSLCEYANDLSVRVFIERVLRSQELDGYDEFRDFETQIHRLDDLLKELFIPNVHLPGNLEWWEAGILRNGGADYAKEIQDFAVYQFRKPED